MLDMQWIQKTPSKGMVELTLGSVREASVSAGYMAANKC
jgi:hypothetical protein